MVLVFIDWISSASPLSQWQSFFRRAQTAPEGRARGRLSMQHMPHPPGSGFSMAFNTIKLCFLMRGILIFSFRESFIYTSVKYTCSVDCTSPSFATGELAFPWSCDSRADPWWNPAYWPSGTKDLKRTRPSIGRHFNWWFIQFSVIPWFWMIVIYVYYMLIYFEIFWYMLIIGKYWGNVVRFF